MTIAPEPVPQTEPSPQAQEPRTRFKPRGGRILLLPDPLEEKRGSIWIPDTARERAAREAQMRMGTIVEVGPGMRVVYKGWRGHRDEHGAPRWPMPPIKPGSRVLYRAHMGSEIIIDGVLHWVLSDDSIDCEISLEGTVTLFWDRLLVQRRARVEQTSSGIALPQTSRKRPLEGTVLQTGPGEMKKHGIVQPCGVKQGDRVTWQPMKGVDVTKFLPGVHTYEGRGIEVMLLFESDLVGVLEGEESPEPIVTKMQEE